MEFGETHSPRRFERGKILRLNMIASSGQDG